MKTNAANRIIHKELSYKLGGIFFNVHNKLGRFLSEKQYADGVENFLKLSNLNYKREYTIPWDVKGNRVDFSIEDKILVDIKAKRLVCKDDYYQMQRYLKSSNIKLGLIVNFRNTYLKPIRVINSFI